MQIEKSKFAKIVLNDILKMIPALEVGDLIAIFRLDAAVAVDLLASLACTQLFLYCQLLLKEEFFVTVILALEDCVFFMVGGGLFGVEFQGGVCLVGLARFEAPFGCWFFLTGLFQSFEQSAAHPLVKFAASYADFCFSVFFLFFPFALDLDHLRANGVVLPLEATLKQLVAPLPLPLPGELHIGPLLLGLLVCLFVEGVPEVGGSFEEERFLLWVVVLGEGEGESDNAVNILRLEHYRVIVINWKIYSFLLYQKFRYLAMKDGKCSGWRVGVSWRVSVKITVIITLETHKITQTNYPYFIGDYGPIDWGLLCA